MNAIEIAERLAKTARENERKPAQINAGATQNASDMSPYVGAKQNAPKTVLTPHDVYRIIPLLGADPITVFFHPPLTVAAVRQFFYKNATEITATTNI